MEYLKNILKIITENRVLMLSMSLDNGGTHQLLLLVKRSKQESIEHNIEIIRMSFPFHSYCLRFFYATIVPWLIIHTSIFLFFYDVIFILAHRLAHRSSLNLSRRNRVQPSCHPPHDLILLHGSLWDQVSEKRGAYKR